MRSEGITINYEDKTYTYDERSELLSNNSNLSRKFEATIYPGIRYEDIISEYDDEEEEEEDDDDGDYDND